ncbi:MAG TPA: M81 family metallopeptidase [Clostridia bacterium]|nr:M81 family metallopeptidase [Clostridia bacterium]
MRKGKIFIGMFSLESNSLTPILTEYDDFVIRRGDAMAENHKPYNYFKEKGYEVVTSINADALPGGTISLDAYTRLSQELLDAIPLDGSIDGVWLHLHGSMDVESLGSGEAILVSRIREIVGPEVPISIALDLHGNITHSLTRISNIICGYRTAPHEDIEDTFMQAAKLLVRALDKKIVPWSMVLKIPLLLPGEYAVTTSGPGKYIISRLNDIDKIEGVWYSSYFAGMAWIDCPANGAALVVTGIGENKEPAKEAMMELANEIWILRDDFVLQDLALLPEESLQRASEEKDKLVFISDSGDNVTAGAVGDNSYMLSLMIEKNITNALLAGIWDPKGVKACETAGEGAELSVELGGLYARESLRTRIKGHVKHLYKDEDGKVTTAIISMSGIDIIVNSIRESVTKVEDFVRYGLNYMDYSIIVVKLGYLYPGLGEIKDVSIMALTTGNTALDIETIPYRLTRRPMYPIDKDFDFHGKNKIY